MCTSPLKGFLSGLTENGKKKLKITSYNTHHFEFINDHWVAIKSEKVWPSIDNLTEWIEIPCGQCIECRLQRSRNWANRCMLEAENHNQSWFITLTYDNNNLPFNEFVDEETGEVLKNATLYKKDVQDFMKRLRAAYKYYGGENKLRFYGCGEYGSTTYRPHYHIIVFGLELGLDDLSPYKRNFNNDLLYNSRLVSSCWKKGFSVLGNLTWQSAAYTARYILKKHLGADRDFYDNYNIAPEFTLMSRRPGIARDFYEDNKDDLFNLDKMTVGDKNGTTDIYSVPYFEKLFESDFPENDVLERKERRKKAAEDKKALILKKTSQNYLEYCQTKDYNIREQMKRLPRNEV